MSASVCVYQRHKRLVVVGVEMVEEGQCTHTRALKHTHTCSTEIPVLQSAS